MLDTFDKVIAFFFVEDQEVKSYFFDETFLLADISIDVVLGMAFLTLSNVEIDLASRHFHWKIYIIVKALLTIRQVELIKKKRLQLQLLI